MLNKYKKSSIKLKHTKRKKSCIIVQPIVVQAIVYQDPVETPVKRKVISSELKIQSYSLRKAGKSPYAIAKMLHVGMTQHIDGALLKE